MKPERLVLILILISVALPAFALLRATLGNVSPNWLTYSSLLLSIFLFVSALARTYLLAKKKPN